MILLLRLAVACQVVSASAPERFVTVSAEGDFVLGCQRFLVAGWNQHALAVLIELRSCTKPCCRRAGRIQEQRTAPLASHPCTALKTPCTHTAVVCLLGKPFPTEAARAKLEHTREGQVPKGRCQRTMLHAETCAKARRMLTQVGACGGRRGRATAAWGHTAARHDRAPGAPRSERGWIKHTRLCSQQRSALHALPCSPGQHACSLTSS